METGVRLQPAPPTLADIREADLEHVHPDFTSCIDSLAGKLRALVNMRPCTFETLPHHIPLRGIYLFSENDVPLYVGRTRKLRQRLGNHCGRGSMENQSVFAFKLARELHGAVKASYAGEGTRKKLMENADFRAHFDTSKQRLRRMEIRWVEEDDPLRQALLEIYVAVVLRTRYNDFDTH